MPPNDLKQRMGGGGAYSLSAAARSAYWGKASSGSRWAEALEAEEARMRKRKAENGKMRENSEGRREWGDPVRMLDEQLARIREAPITTVSGPGKFAVSVDMNIFRPEDIEVLMSVGLLVVAAEREVRLDAQTSVVRSLRRKVTIPSDVSTEAVAVHMSGRGILTITALRRRSC